MKLKLYIIAYILFSFLSIHSAKVGTWTLYPSFYNIQEIAPIGDKAYALASGSLFSYNTKDGSLETYDKTTILSDFDIAHIKYNNTCKKLIITYNNSNIDLLSDNNTIENISELCQYSTTSSKHINHIYNDGQYAYLSLGLGIVKIDVKNGNISDTYQLGFEVNYSYVDGDYLYAASASSGLYRGKMTDNLLDKNNWIRVGNYINNEEDYLNVYSPTTKYWWTTTQEGKLTYYTLDSNNERNYKTEGIRPKGPASNNFYRLYLHNGKLYATGGFYSQERDGQYPGEVHVWDGESWTEFEQPTENVLGHRNQDWLSMDFDPLKEGHVMLAAKTGLYEFQDEKFIKCYNMDNSPLTSCVNNPDYIIATDLMYDKAGTLWLFNSSVEKSFWTIDKNNNWTALNINSQLKYNNDLRNLFISKSNGKMWFLSNYWDNCQLYEYDYINDQLNCYGPSFINEDNSTITPHYLHRIAEDKNGNIWMCTTSGPLYFSAENIQAGNAEFTQHKVPRNDGTNYADYLLDNVETRSIAIDGENRKWIGTNGNGVYLISSDCNSQIDHFTTENSPLPSNAILDILIEPNTGKVYFATNNGLCSYMSGVIDGNQNMSKDNVYAYPNPVRPNYTGNITIVGLTPDTDIKIVTSNGVLVNQGRSNGNTYIWNGCDLKGKKVASGIYMAEIANTDGQKGVVCKIAIIN